MLFLVMSLGAGLVQTQVSRLYGRMVDYGIAGQANAMLALVLPMVSLLLLDFGRACAGTFINAVGTERVFLDLRMRAYGSLLRAKAEILDKQLRSGDVVVRLNSDLYELCEAIAGRMLWLIRVVLMAIVALVSCLLLSWQLSLVYIILLPITMAVTRHVSAPIEKQQRERSARVGSAMNVATDMLHGLMVTKAFNLAEYMAGRFGRHSDDAVASAIETEKASVKIQVARYVSGLLPVVATLAMGLLLITRGEITVGTVVAFIAISAHIRFALDLMGYMAQALRTAQAQAGRICEILDLPPEEEGQTFQRNDQAPVVAMDNLFFGYEDQPDVLKTLTLHVSAGEKIGLVGPSGCGKSSILRLICRFYSHQSGEMKLFGHPAQLWSPDALRRGLSIVTQDPHLFDGTLYENVAYGREGATHEEIMAAIDSAYLTEFAESLPQGVHTSLGEAGARLSGGQKQRIAIARAMLKDAPLVLLDEATSALDTASEAEVQRALDRLLEGRAAILISHRLSTLNNVDRILFLEEGRIAEQGTRDELMQVRGRFYQMALLQAKGGAEHD
jgi:ABC-type multidrug transport system fused ATPase/permease subunit